MLLNTAINSRETQHCDCSFYFMSLVKVVYMFEISTASATGVQHIFGRGACLFFGLTAAALIREQRLFGSGA